MTIALGPYTLDSLVAAEADFNFTDPITGGLQAENSYRQWCWHNLDTTSSNVGPTSGAGGSPDGYVYTEGSSTGVAGDEFEMELDETLDCLNNDNVTVEWKTNQRGTDNDATCQLQTNEDGAGWVNRGALFGGSGDSDKVATGGTQIWSQRSVDISALGVDDASTRVRLKIIFGGSTIWNCDYGIDEVEVTGDTLSTAEVEQEGYRFYNDGTESGSVARQDQDTVDTIAREITFQERVLLNATDDPDTEQYQLEYKEVSDGVAEWRKVPLT